MALALEEAGGRAGQAAHPHHHAAFEQVRLKLNAPAQPDATADAASRQPKPGCVANANKAVCAAVNTTQCMSNNRTMVDSLKRTVISLPC